MATHPLDTPKWRLPEVSRLSMMMREAVFEAVRRNLDALGDARWSEIVNARTLELFSAEDAARIDREVVAAFMDAEGRKLLAGSEVAVAEMPDRYVLRSEWAAAQDLDVSDLADLPNEVVGVGDNVLRAADLEGTVLLIRQVGEVSRLMVDGVPEGTIGLIDDAGGTMTAPILPDLAGVLCLAGTVQSHLAIIAREYGIPTLMGVRLRRPLPSGAHVRVGYSARVQSAKAYHGGEKVPAATITELAR